MNFNQGYYELHYSQILHVKKDVDEIENRIDMKKVKTIYEFCCGFGRYSNELAKRGYDVIGIDRSEYLINKAREDAVRIGVNDKVSYYVKDIQEFEGETRDLVICMFNSIGYLLDDYDENFGIDNMLKHVKKGGYCIIDIYGENQRTHEIERKFPSGKWNKCSTRKMPGNILEIENTYFNGAKTYSSITRIKYFTLIEWQDIFKRNGFRNVKIYDGFSEKLGTNKSETFLIIAQK